MASRNPYWKLNDYWGVDTDSYNWILYRRADKKDGTMSGWREVGYYPTPEKLLGGLLRKVMRQSEKSPDFIEYVERHYEALTGLQDAFYSKVESHYCSKIKPALAATGTHS